MAFIQNNQNEEEDKNLQGGAPGQSGDSEGLLSSSSSISSPKNTPNKSQSFATLQSYLKPNQPQGEALAGQIASKTAAVGDEAKNQVEQAAGTVGGLVQQNTPNYDASLISNAVANPTEFVKDPNNIEAFTKQRTAAYNGPSAWDQTTEAQSATAKVGAANEKAKLLDSESGRKQLLADVQENKGAGITSLNQALLSTNPNATNVLQGAKSSFSGLEDLLKGKATDVNAKIAAANDAANKARTDVSTKLGSKVNEFGTDLTGRINSSRENLASTAQSAMAKLQNGEPLTPQELTALNTDQATIDEIRRQQGILKSNYGQNFEVSPYATSQSADAIDPSAFASTNDYDTEKALEQLTGEDLPYLQESGRKNAGTAPSTLLNFRGSEAQNNAMEALKTQDTNYSNSQQWNVGPNYGQSQQAFNQDLSNLLTGKRPVGPNETMNGHITPETFLRTIQARVRLGKFPGIDPRTFEVI